MELSGSTLDVKHAGTSLEHFLSHHISEFHENHSKDKWYFPTKTTSRRPNDDAMVIRGRREQALTSRFLDQIQHVYLILLFFLFLILITLAHYSIPKFRCVSKMWTPKAQPVMVEAPFQLTAFTGSVWPDCVGKINCDPIAQKPKKREKHPKIQKFGIQLYGTYIWQIKLLNINYWWWYSMIIEHLSQQLPTPAKSKKPLTHRTTKATHQTSVSSVPHVHAMVLTREPDKVSNGPIIWDMGLGFTWL